MRVSALLAARLRYAEIEWVGPVPARKSSRILTICGGLCLLQRGDDKPLTAQAIKQDLGDLTPAAETAGASWAQDVDALPIYQCVQTVPARRLICRERDEHESVPIIRSGWAASVIPLSDGSRQILSFLLPGDLISTTLLFESRLHCVVEAVTDVSYGSFKRSELQQLLFLHPSLLDRLSRAWIEEKNRADQLIVDLGRRTADERIARLILSLADRLARRGMTRGDGTSAIEMDFPLRQHHIADATGLTPVHVSKVLTEFRRNSLIRISDRSLAVLDPAGFRRVANMR
jgi:CRP/FNR family transcriptional regulator, anaerobic regulatory protein